MTLKTTKEQRDALLIKLDDPDFNVYNTITVYNSVVRDLCHDADRAGELEKEVARLDDGWTEAIEVSNAFYAQTCKLQEENAGLRAQLEEEAKEHEAKLKEQQAASNNLNERLGNCKQSAKEGWRYAYELEQERKKLNEENADLRAKLDRYTRIAESGKSYGDDLDNIERIAELELENTQDYLDIERALSGQRLLYNRPLAIRVADLRAQLDEANDLAMGIYDDLERRAGLKSYRDNDGAPVFELKTSLWVKLHDQTTAIRALKEQEK